MRFAITFLLASAALLAQGTEPDSIGKISADCFMTDKGVQQATGRSAALDNRHTACTSWRLLYAAWNPNTTALSIEVDQAQDSQGAPGSWSAWSGTVSVGANPSTSTSSGEIDFSGFEPWISINVGTLTASSGTPGITWVLIGYKVTAASGGGGASSSITSLPTATNTFATINSTTPSASFALTADHRNHTVQIELTSGSLTGCTVNLDGSLDGTSWFNISGNQNCNAADDSSGTGVMFHVSEKPVAFVRINVSTLTGTSPVLTAKYMGVR